MSYFEQAVHAFRVEIVLKAAMSANGNFGAAARTLGVHRNLVSRVLGEAGYSSRRVRQMVRHHQAVTGRKPVQSARPGDCSAARRIA